MPESLESYVRSRAKELGLSLTEVCRRAGVSRETLYALTQNPLKPRRNHWPTLPTLFGLAEVLKIHPLQLLHLFFDNFPQGLTGKQLERKRGDISAFVSDVSYPDGALVLPRQSFTKTWELQNVGLLAWENRYLQCQDEDIVVYARTGEKLTLAPNLQPSTNRIVVPFTEPGKTVKLSVQFTAPEQPCTVLSYWKMVFEDGSFCFPGSTGVWVKVRVTTMATAASRNADDYGYE